MPSPPDGVSVYQLWDIRVRFAGQEFEWYGIDMYSNRSIIIYVDHEGYVDLRWP
jgi:hypothetical protein